MCDSPRDRRDVAIPGPLCLVGVAIITGFLDDFFHLGGEFDLRCHRWVRPFDRDELEQYEDTKKGQQDVHNDFEDILHQTKTFRFAEA